MALNHIGKRGLQLRTDLPVISIHLGLFYCNILLFPFTLYTTLTCSGLDKVVDIIAN